MKRFIPMTVLLLAVWACAGMSVFASSINGTGPAGSDPPIAIDGGWYGFCFAGAGSAATAGCQGEGVGVTGNDITFTATTNVLLEVTDAFETGDSFDVYVNGPLGFSTPTVAASSTCSLADCADPNQTYGDPDYSYGSMLLGPGSYTVDIFARDSPWGGGGAYVQVVTATTPEPATLLLLGAGLLGLGTRLRKRFIQA